MLITIKNLQQQTFTVEFDAAKTVLELKLKIFNDRGSEYVVEKQKLIYAGVILVDERTIESYNVDEKKFVVVMLTRDAAPAAQSCFKESDKPVGRSIPLDRSSESTEKSTVNAETSTAPESITPFASTLVAHAPTDPGNARTDSSNELVDERGNESLQLRAESNLLMGDEYNQTVTSMVEMGYPREQVERAMAASFNNPERAVEYLINGIPDEGESIFDVGEQSANPTSISNTAQNMSLPSVSLPTNSSSSDPFEFLRSQPQFLQMRSLIYQNPHLLHAVLQQIGQTNPALLQLISENQDAFLNMLNQPIEGETGAGETVSRSSTNRRRRVFSSELEGAVAAQRPGANDLVRENQTTGNDDFDQPLGVATISLNPQDQEAIERLKALGFPEALVLQAYFACEKNEELAANFLLSSSFDD
ncbi:hypothetical protein KR018_001476 [Drosophila ironensis]|nr:hypothetical protein KR018_001476 [Drosophila ironensis]